MSRPRASLYEFQGARTRYNPVPLFYNPVEQRPAPSWTESDETRLHFLRALFMRVDPVNWRYSANDNERVTKTKENIDNMFDDYYITEVTQLFEWLNENPSRLYYEVFADGFDRIPSLVFDDISRAGYRATSENITLKVKNQVANRLVNIVLSFVYCLVMRQNARFGLMEQQFLLQMVQCFKNLIFIYYAYMGVSFIRERPPDIKPEEKRNNIVFIDLVERKERLNQQEGSLFEKFPVFYDILRRSVYLYPSDLSIGSFDEMVKGVSVLSRVDEFMGVLEMEQVMPYTKKEYLKRLWGNLARAERERFFTYLDTVVYTRTLLMYVFRITVDHFLRETPVGGLTPDKRIFSSFPVRSHFLDFLMFLANKIALYFQDIERMVTTFAPSLTKEDITVLNEGRDLGAIGRILERFRQVKIEDYTPTGPFSADKNLSSDEIQDFLRPRQSDPVTGTIKNTLATIGRVKKEPGQQKLSPIAFALTDSTLLPPQTSPTGRSMLSFEETVPEGQAETGDVTPRPPKNPPSTSRPLFSFAKVDLQKEGKMALEGSDTDFASKLAKALETDENVKKAIYKARVPGQEIQTALKTFFLSYSDTANATNGRQVLTDAIAEFLDREEGGNFIATIKEVLLNEDITKGLVSKLLLDENFIRQLAQFLKTDEILVKIFGPWFDMRVTAMTKELTDRIDALEKQLKEETERRAAELKGATDALRDAADREHHLKQAVGEAINKQEDQERRAARELEEAKQKGEKEESAKMEALEKKLSDRIAVLETQMKEGLKLKEDEAAKQKADAEAARLKQEAEAAAGEALRKAREEAAAEEAKRKQEAEEALRKAREEAAAEEARRKQEAEEAAAEEARRQEPPQPVETTVTDPKLLERLQKLEEAMNNLFDETGQLKLPADWTKSLIDINEEVAKLVAKMNGMEDKLTELENNAYGDQEKLRNAIEALFLTLGAAGGSDNFLTLLQMYNEFKRMNRDYEKRLAQLTRIRTRVKVRMLRAREGDSHNAYLCFGTYESFIQEIVVTLRATAPYCKEFLNAIEQTLDDEQLMDALTIENNELNLWKKWVSIKKIYEGSIEYITMTQIKLAHDVFSLVSSRVSEYQESAYKLLSDEYRDVVQDVIQRLVTRLRKNPDMSLEQWSIVVNTITKNKVNDAFRKMSIELKDAKRKLLVRMVEDSDSESEEEQQGVTGLATQAGAPFDDL